MTLNSRLLSERTKAVLETMRMRLSEKQALAYLKELGFECSPATWYREKNKLEKLKLKRLYHIAQIGFQNQHLERIDVYEMGFKMMWQNVLLEKDPYKRNSMIKDILLLQPYLSAYYEATKLVIDKQQQSEYQEFLDTQQQIRQEEKITEFKQQIHNEQENSRNYDDDDYEEEYNNNNNAKF